MWRPLAVSLAALWIAAGALFKLFLGSPNDLPPVVHELPGPIGTKYAAIIAVELAIAWVAILRSRVGWVLVAALLVVFDVVLAVLLARGAESCGCFGSSVEVSPAVMMAIDSALLVLLLAARPWSARPLVDTRLSIVAAAVLASLVVPWLVDRSPNAEGESDPWAGRPWVSLEPEAWVGQMLYDIPLAGHVSFDLVPPDATVVFWRAQCDHCAQHLEAMALEDLGVHPIVLVELPHPSDSEDNRVVQLKPHGPHVLELRAPDHTDWILTTPYEFELEDALIQPRTPLDQTRHGGP